MDVDQLDQEVEQEEILSPMVQAFRDLRMRLDPVAFGTKLMKALFGEKTELDDWQKRVLATRHRRLCLVTSRQVGKSTVIAIMALFTAIYTRNALVILLAPTERQSKELFKKVVAFARKFGDLPELAEDNRTSMAFENGSRIVALPGGSPDAIRGFSGPKLVIVDEAAFAGDALYRAIRPMLAVNKGRLVLISSPNGKFGFFYDAYRSKRFEVYEIPANLCPRITPDFLEEERDALGDVIFMREYFCHFVDAEYAVFGYDLIMQAISDDAEAVSPTGPDALVDRYIKALER